MSPDINIFDILTRAWACFSKRLGLVLAVVVIELIVALVFCAIPGLNVIYSLFVQCAIAGGVTIFLLKAVRGGDPEVGDLVQGFRDYLKWEAVGLLRGFVFLVICIPGLITLGAAGFFNQHMRVPLPPGIPTEDLPFDVPSAMDPHAYIMIGAGALITLLIAGYFMLRWLYVLPCAADGAGILDAFGQSAQLTRGRYGQLGMIYLGLGFVNLLGGLLCCVGGIFTSGLTYLAHMIVYDDLRRFHAQGGLQYGQAEYVPQQQSGPISRLAVTAGPHAGEVFALTANPIVIGREPGNGVALVRDMMASRQHARLIYDGIGWQVEDLGSTNGIYVNGQRVSTVTLNPGDQLQIGQTLFTAQ